MVLAELDGGALEPGPPGTVMLTVVVDVVLGVVVLEVDVEVDELVEVEEVDELVDDDVVLDEAEDLVVVVPLGPGLEPIPLVRP